MITIDEIFCLVDDFCKEKQVNYNPHLLSPVTPKRQRATKLSESEIITILIYFHYSKMRDFNAYYTLHIGGPLQSAFPDLISYNRFIELIPRVLESMYAFLQRHFVPSTGIAFIDSSELPVCHPKRMKRNKVFQGTGAIGKSSKGWFFGFKMHLLINHDGGLVSAKITPGNVNDRKPVIEMARTLGGKLFGDKGYISKTLTKKLMEKGVTLITSIKKNMKPQVLSLFDKAVLKKRSLIESVNNQLKKVFHIEHTRHRSPINAFVHMFAGLAAYCLNPNKPSANIEYISQELLEAEP